MHQEEGRVQKQACSLHERRFTIPVSSLPFQWDSPLRHLFVPVNLQLELVQSRGRCATTMRAWVQRASEQGGTSSPSSLVSAGFEMARLVNSRLHNRQQTPLFSKITWSYQLTPCSACKFWSGSMLMLWSLALLKERRIIRSW